MVNVVYTHRTYHDVLEKWMVCNSQFSPVKDFVVFSDAEFLNSKTALYDNSWGYSKRLLSCLMEVSSDYILYQHEDMLLHEAPDTTHFNECLNAIRTFDFVRLSHTGNPDKIVSESPIVELCGQEFFAIQPTIWKRKSLISLLESCGECDMYSLETKHKKDFPEIRGGMWGCTKEKVGGHYRSTAWPYIATAIVKGVWNTSEYKREIDNLGISTSERGTNG